MAIASCSQKNLKKTFAHKQLFTHPTNQHKTTCHGLASSHTCPHRSLSCEKQKVGPQFSSGKTENSNKKSPQNPPFRLWTCTASKKTEIQTFAQLAYLPHFFIYTPKTTCQGRPWPRPGPDNLSEDTICKTH
jgi:hypothetical protein